MEDDKPANQNADPAPGAELSDEDVSKVAGGTLGSTGQERSLKLQLLMDRRSKVEASVSNILKAAGSTQESIIGNLK